MAKFHTIKIITDISEFNKYNLMVMEQKKYQRWIKQYKRVLVQLQATGLMPQIKVFCNF